MATERSSDEAVFNRTRWRERLAREYEPAAQRLTRAYGATVDHLLPLADDVTRDLLEMIDQGVTPDATALIGMDSYQRLLVRMRVEMREFGAIVRAESMGLQTTGIEQGIATARAMAVAVGAEQTPALGAAVGAAWVQPDPAALETLINYADGAAMQQKMAAFGANAASTFNDIMISGFAQGKNPREIARMMRSFIAGTPLAWATNTARTVTIYSYRSANHAAYAANADVVEGWRWSSARDIRTCISCWSQHGKIFSLDQFLNDHHSGRCAPVPVVRGAQWIKDQPTGPELFAKLPESAQRQIMGPQLLDLWQRGSVNWDDFSERYVDPVYGEMLRAASNRSMVSGRSGGGARQGGADTVLTIDGRVQRDLGSPGNSEESLSAFASTSNGPLGRALTEGRYGTLLDADFASDGFVINRSAVYDAAKAFVVESRDITLGRDYLLNSVQWSLGQQGISVTPRMAAQIINQEFATQARAILTAAEAGNVRLTEAQRRRLGLAADGGYLDMVYADGDVGTIERGIRRANAGAGASTQNMTAAARAERRENFLRMMAGLN